MLHIMFTAAHRVNVFHVPGNVKDVPRRVLEMASIVIEDWSDSLVVGKDRYGLFNFQSGDVKTMAEVEQYADSLRPKPKRDPLPDDETIDLDEDVPRRAPRPPLRSSGLNDFAPDNFGFD